MAILHEAYPQPTHLSRVVFRKLFLQYKLML
jgi:hypothetical protein